MAHIIIVIIYMVYAADNKVFLFFFRMSNKYPTLDWNDTFLDIEHLRNSFPDYEIEMTTGDVEKHKPPFR